MYALRRPHLGLPWALAMVSKRGFMDGEASNIYQYDWERAAQKNLEPEQRLSEYRRIRDQDPSSFSTPEWFDGVSDRFMQFIGAFPRCRVDSYHACLSALSPAEE